jgi:hypothetical protein
VIRENQAARRLSSNLAKAQAFDNRNWRLSSHPHSPPLLQTYSTNPQCLSPPLSYLCEANQDEDIPKTYTPGKGTDWEITVQGVIHHFDLENVWPEKFQEDMDSARRFVSGL